MQDWIELTAEGLDTVRAMGHVGCAEAGGIAVFLGTTRAELGAGGRELVALEYEAYEEMARTQLKELLAEARLRWPVQRGVLLHRLGRVGVGEPSVLIAVSTPHRAEAFEACRWFIDTLKASVAIWKRPIWNNGPGEWQGAPAADAKV